ncbi:MAG: hypothetical protein ACXWB9_04005 [Flavisolibacter sp.]
MNRFLFFSLLFFFITGCSKKISVKHADRIRYEYDVTNLGPGSLSYSIDLVPSRLELRVTSFDIDGTGYKPLLLLREVRPFSRASFDSVLSKFEGLRKQKPGEDIKGASQLSCAFYKEGVEIFTAEDGNKTNFTGAEINLAYLVPDLDSMLARVAIKK